MFKLRKKTWAGALAGVTGMLLAFGTATPAVASTGATTATSTYELNVAGNTTTLTEGETVVYPMLPVDPDGKTVSPNVVYPGDGTGTLTVTAKNGVYHYSIDMHVPATNFIGAFTDGLRLLRGR